MPQQSRSYTNFLSDVDRVVIRQVRERGAIVEFSVQYEALINSRWRKITRYDSSHYYPHRHVYYPNRPEYKHAMNTTDNNNAFTEAQLVIKKNFRRMRESYIILIRNVGGGEL